MTLHEFDIIQHFFKKDIDSDANVILGIGDDAAIVSIPNNHELVITIDTLVSGVHFPENTHPYDIGYKALAVNLSDLAAMGATPKWITLALTLPNADTDWLKKFSTGLFDLANQYKTTLIGGDTTRGPLSITIQAHGFVPHGLALRRDGAKSGDLIYVTNSLGDAGLALQRYATETLQTAIAEKFYRPHPQIHIGQKLRGIANSAIDISDGLAADLTHILEKSSVGACINVDALPLSEAMLKAVSLNEAIHLALTAGDDYELCFTVPKEKTKILEDALLNFSYTCIGTVTASPGLDLQFQNGKKYDLKVNGYQHF